MPELTDDILTAFTALAEQIAPSLGLSLSEQLNQLADLADPQVTGVSLPDLLARHDTGLNTVFSLSLPSAAESLFFFSENAALRFAAMIAGGDGSSPPTLLDDTQTESLGVAMSGLVGGLANALSTALGEPVELEACSTSLGPLALPPVFALESNAVEVRYTLTLENVDEEFLTFLFVPEIVDGLSRRASEPPAASAVASAPAASGGMISEDDLDAMLKDMNGAGSGFAPTSGGYNPLMPLPSEGPMPRGIELILDIPLDVTVELGRVRMLIRDVLELASGSIIELDRVAGEPVDLLVNGRLIAKGEVVVIEDNFGIRVTEIVSPADRVANLGKGR